VETRDQFLARTTVERALKEVYINGMFDMLEVGETYLFKHRYSDWNQVGKVLSLDPSQVNVSTLQGEQCLSYISWDAYTLEYINQSNQTKESK